MSRVAAARMASRVDRPSLVFAAGSMVFVVVICTNQSVHRVLSPSLKVKLGERRQLFQLLGDQKSGVATWSAAITTGFG